MGQDDSRGHERGRPKRRLDPLVGQTLASPGGPGTTGRLDSGVPGPLVPANPAISTAGQLDSGITSAPVGRPDLPQLSVPAGSPFQLTNSNDLMSFLNRHQRGQRQRGGSKG